MKRLLTKYLNYYFCKHYNNKNYKSYLFHRWLAQLIYTYIPIIYCSNIDSYLFDFAGVVYECPQAQLTDVFHVGNIIYIVTTTPGEWIGKKGKFISDLEHSINYNLEGIKIHDFKLRIIEDCQCHYKIRTIISTRY